MTPQSASCIGWHAVPSLEGEISWTYAGQAGSMSACAHFSLICNDHIRRYRFMSRGHVSCNVLQESMLRHIDTPITSHAAYLLPTKTLQYSIDGCQARRYISIVFVGNRSVVEWSVR